jgi:chromosome segregation ATPase
MTTIEQTRSYLAEAAAIVSRCTDKTDSLQTRYRVALASGAPDSDLSAIESEIATIQREATRAQIRHDALTEQLAGLVAKQKTAEIDKAKTAFFEVDRKLREELAALDAAGLVFCQAFAKFKQAATLDSWQQHRQVVRSLGADAPAERPPAMAADIAGVGMQLHNVVNNFSMLHAR